MTQHAPHHEHEASHTNEAFEHNPVRQYLIIWGTLMVLLIVTILAAGVHIPEPWSFIIATLIAISKAVLVILFFMHVKDASRVTWCFCACSFIWLGIMLAMTFNDYLTREPGTGTTIQAEMQPGPEQVHRAR